jgi:hypothetical protein
MVEQHSIGTWIPDLPDQRDRLYRVSEVKGKLPSSVDLRDKCPPVYDQGALGSCTANAIGATIEFDRLKQGLDDFTPSRLFIYYNERDIEGTVSVDSGAMIRDGIKSVNIMGACSEKTWPYDISKFTQRAPMPAYMEGAEHEAISYERIPRDLFVMKSCLASGYPFVFGFTVYDSFETQEVATTGEVPLPDSEEKVLGGHAVMACFTKDTKISLLNGEEKSFEQLIKEKLNSFWVYSCDEKGNIVPGLAHSPRKTGEKRPILKITLDNNEQIKCTENHLFMLRDGSYKEAINLSIGESLMPLYRRKSTTEGMKGYDMFWNNNKKKYELTHRYIYAFMNGGKYEDEVVHHIDFNKLNNNPDNMVGMTWKDHTKLHNEQVKLLEGYSKSEQGRLKSKELMEKLWSNNEWNKKTREQNKLNGEKSQLKFSILRSKKKLSIKEFILREVNKIDKKKTIAINNLKNHNEGVSKGIIKPTEKQIQARRINGKNNLSKERRSIIAKQLNEKRWNHKIVNIEKTGQEDVYDITVEKYHNFALSAGVFVHNCGYDDSTQRFIVRNSWSDGWGKKGYFTMPYEYLTNSDLSDDMWRITIVT